MDPLFELGRVLRGHGFDERGLAGALAGMDRWTALSLRDVRRPGAGALTPLVELFTLGAPVAEAELHSAVAPVELAALEAEGLIRRHGGFASSPVRITPASEQLIVHDPWAGPKLAADHVGGPNDAAATLDHVTVRRPVDAALDLGTGSGIQALAAADHARRVVATDINPRALALAWVNARLNGVPPLDCREGDLFAPVRGERFGLIVANPPYVVSPDTELLFRDSGRAPGERCRDIVAGAPDHLTENGFACVLANWVGDEPWDAPRAWTDGLGCDVYVLSFGAEDPFGYAARWTEPPASADALEHAAAVERWMAFYRRSGVEKIWFGAVIMRRRGRAGWFRGVDVEQEGSGAAGDHVLRLFEAADFLAQGDDVTRERFRPVPGGKLTHVLAHRDGDYALEQATVTLGEGLGLRSTLDPLAVHAFLALAGERELGRIVADVAAERGLDAAALGASAVPAVRRMYELGLLLRG